MPNSALASLPTAGTLDNTELYYIVQNGLDRKVDGFQSKRLLLQADTTFYISPSGVDVHGGGTAAAPWATLQFAIHHLEEHIDVAGWAVTIQLAAGTTGSPNVYAGFEMLNIVGGGQILIESSDGDPTHTTITSATQSPLRMFLNTTAFIAVGGVTITTTGASAEPLIYLSGDFAFCFGTINCPNVVLGPIAANTFLLSITDHSTVSDNTLNPSTSITLAPGGLGCAGFVSVSSQGNLFLTGTYTITGNPDWSTAFLNITYSATANVHLEVGSNVTGASTGMRYICERMSVLRHSAALNTLPGNADGRAINCNVLDTTTNLFADTSTPIAVTSLPTPGTLYNGARRMVSDASSPVFGAIVSGSSSTVVPVYCDGTNWRVG